MKWGKQMKTEGVDCGPWGKNERGEKEKGD